MADPPTVEHRGLVDDVVAALHGRNRFRLALLVRARPITVQPRDAPPLLLLELDDVALLVPPAAIADQVERGVLQVRLVELATRHRQVEGAQVAALKEAHQVGRRNDQRAPAWPLPQLHARTLVDQAVPPPRAVPSPRAAPPPRAARRPFLTQLHVICTRSCARAHLGGCREAEERPRNADRVRHSPLLAVASDRTPPVQRVLAGRIPLLAR